MAAGGGAVDCGGRTSIGRRGGAGGACPVLGSSTRSRSVGGTTRPVDGGVTGRAAGGGRTAGAGATGRSTGGASTRAAIVGTSGAGEATGAGFGAAAGDSTRRGSAGATTGSGSGAGGIAGSGSIAIGAGAAMGSGVTGAAMGSADSGAGVGSAGAGGLAVLISRGAGIAGTAGFGGSDGRPCPFFAPPRAGAGESANDAFDGTLMPRCRARRPTNSRATTSSIVLDALFTSMPWSRFNSAITS